MTQPMTRTQLLQQFQLSCPVDYHRQALERVAHFKPQELRQAAVLIGFVERPQGLQVLFTKRAAHLKHHPGQISFPGGKFEAEDLELTTTALRETREEAGILPQHVTIFGQMPPLASISRFTVTPYLAFISGDYQPAIDHNEVEELFEVPADIVLDPAQLHSHTFLLNGRHHRVFGLSYQRHFIWGMTAQIIQALQQQFHHYPAD